MRKRNQTLPIVLIVVLMMNLLAACGTGGVEQETIMNPEPILSEHEAVFEAEHASEPAVEITMPEYELTYSGEMKDILSVEEIQGENGSGLEFTAKLSKSEVTVFTLHYNTDDGDLVTVLTDASGNRIPVSFKITTIPNNLSEEDKLTFYAAQEIVNEVSESIVLK